MDNKLRKQRIHIPEQVLFNALNLNHDSFRPPVFYYWDTCARAIDGLRRHGLLGSHWWMGTKTHMAQKYGQTAKAGAVLTPIISGIELFLWSNGKQHTLLTDFLTTSPIDPDMGFPIAAGASKMQED